MPPFHDTVVRKIAREHESRNQRVRAHLTGFRAPDTHDNYRPDIFVESTKRLYEIKTSYTSFRTSINQLQALNDYPDRKAFYIVITRDLDRADSLEFYELLDDYDIDAKVRSYIKMYEDLGIR